MSDTITLTLPSEIKRAFDAVILKEGISPSELIGKALEEYLFFRRLRLLRERMILKAQEQGICTEQDVFDRVS